MGQLLTTLHNLAVAALVVAALAAPASVKGGFEWGPPAADSVGASDADHPQLGGFEW